VKQRTRVLVTYGWCRTAYVAVRALSRRGYEVFTCDSKTPAMCAWSRFSKDGARVADPFAAPEAFTRDVAELVERWRIDVVLPGHEDGLVLRRFQHLLPAGTALACPDLETFETSVDKAAFTRVALDAGLATPRTRFPSSVDEAIAGARDLGYPVVVKVRRSNSGKGVRVVHSDAELRELLEGPFVRFSETPHRFPILQEMVPGDVVGACFLAQRGEVLALFQERYLRCKDGTFGTSTYRAPMSSGPVGDASRRIVAALGYHGIGHLDLIMPPDVQEPTLLEMNPRLWGAVNLAWVNGLDFPSAAVAQSLGEGRFERYFRTREKPLASLWITGEAISAVNELRRGTWWAPLRLVLDLARALPVARYDDFVWHDPAPLFAELICYAKLWRQAGGSTNPDVEGMLE